VTFQEHTKTIKRRDGWSPWLLAVAVIIVILFWWSIVASAGLLTILLLAYVAAVFLGVTVIALLVSLVTRRIRAALSVLVAIAIIPVGIAVRISMLNAARYADFAVHRAGYERTVAAWRAKNPGTVPLRLILEDVDRSVWVVPSVFDYIVYDDSDAIGKNPPKISGGWQCATPECGSGLISGGSGNLVVKPFGGHFYFVEQTL
jgi:hypothetical protein